MLSSENVIFRQLGTKRRMILAEHQHESAGEKYLSSIRVALADEDLGWRTRQDTERMSFAEARELFAMR